MKKFIVAVVTHTAVYYSVEATDYTDAKNRVTQDPHRVPIAKRSNADIHVVRAEEED